jgi:anti-sigma-K factor RskA
MSNGHPTREEDFDLYVLGALEGDEKQAIESHLTGCGDCARKLAAARGRIAALSFSAPRTAPSPAVKERLMRQVRAEAEGRIVVERPAREIAPRLDPSRGSGGRWWLPILAPACAVLLIATFYLWKQNNQLTREVNQFRATMITQQRQLADVQETLSLYASKDTIKVALAQQPGMPKGDVKVMYNAKMGMLMCDGWVEPAQANKSYQLWIVPMEGKPVSAGVFSPDNAQAWHKMMKVPGGIEPKMFAITLEPAGGMPQPTGPMVLIGPA